MAEPPIDLEKLRKDEENINKKKSDDPIIESIRERGKGR